ncbi:MAG: TolC family protein, partial [Planctomycetota bacterium]
VESGGADDPDEVNTRQLEMGVRQRTILGTQWEAAWTLTRTADNRDFSTVSKRHENNLQLRLTQPLLRNAWPEFNLAQIRISKLDRDVSIAQFRQRVQQVITDTISTYWNLYRLRQEVRIQEWLLEETRETNRITQAHQDARPNVEKRQSEVAVKQRFTELIQLRNDANDAQHRLAQLLGIAQAELQTSLRIVATTAPAVAPLDLDRTDQLVTALRYNPTLAQARLAIALSAVNVSVAENQVLPRLDLIASANPYGLGEEGEEAVREANTLDDIGYSFGFTFEYPLLNRDATAELRRRRLERLQSITSMQSTIDQLAQAIHERVRQVYTSHEVWLAQKETVQSLQGLVEGTTALVRERQMTLENLQLLLDSQARLSQARRQLLQAAANYNIAIAELSRATGTLLDQHGVKMDYPAPLEIRPLDLIPQPVEAPSSPQPAVPDGPAPGREQPGARIPVGDQAQPQPGPAGLEEEPAEALDIDVQDEDRDGGEQLDLEPRIAPNE